jgi:hypothetical protein
MGCAENGSGQGFFFGVEQVGIAPLVVEPELQLSVLTEEAFWKTSTDAGFYVTELLNGFVQKLLFQLAHWLPVYASSIGGT